MRLLPQKVKSLPTPAPGMGLPGLGLPGLVLTHFLQLSKVFFSAPLEVRPTSEKIKSTHEVGEEEGVVGEKEGLPRLGRATLKHERMCLRGWSPGCLLRPGTARSTTFSNVYTETSCEGKPWAIMPVTPAVP